MSTAVPRRTSWKVSSGTAFPASPVIVGGMGIAMIAQIVSTVLRLVNAPLAARILGPDDFGLYRLALSVAAVATVLVSGGLQNAILSLIPRRRVSSTQGGAATLSFATWYAVISSAVLAIAAVIYRHELARLLGQPSAAPYLGIIMASLPFGVILVTTQAGARSLFAFAEAVIPSNILRPVLLALLLTGLLLADTSPFLVAWVYTLSGIAGAVVATVAVMRLREFGVRWIRPSLSFDGELLKHSLPFLAITLLQIVNESIMVFILSRTTTAADVGLYAAADRASALVAAVLFGMNLVFAPAIAALWAERAHSRLRTFFRRTTKWTLALAVPPCLIMTFSGGSVLQIFGPEYAGVSTALVLLAAGQLVNAGTGAVGYMLILTGHHRLVIVNTLGSLIASAVLGGLIVPSSGVTGAAAVSATVMMGMNLIMLLQVWIVLRMHPYTSDTLRIVAAGAGTAAVGWMLSTQVWSSWQIGLIVTAVGILASNAVLLAIIGITTEDRDLLRLVVQQVRDRIGDRRVAQASSRA